MPPGRRPCASGRCGRTSSRSRRCSRAARVIRTGLPGAQDLGRLRPHRAARRLGGNARGDHGADAAPLRDPGACGRRPRLVPVTGGRLPHRGRCRRRGRRRAPARAGRRDEHPRDQHVLGDVLSGAAEPVPGVGRAPRARSTAISSSSSSSRRRKELSRSSTSATPTLALACGRPATTPHTPGRSSGPGLRHCSTDVCVPLGELPAAVTLARAAADRLGLRAGDPRSRRRRQLPRRRDPRPRRCRRDRAAGTSFRGSSSRTPSPVGARAPASTASASASSRPSSSSTRDLLPLYRGIKQLFDPHGMMNPGKVIAAP